MSLKQISVFLENKPGTLLSMTGLLAKNHIDMRALSIAETKDFGIVRMIVDDVYDTATVLKDAGFVHSLTPVLGVVTMPQGKSFVMADIPGLIEGAWEGVGLGHQFLRHVERCRLLVHVVDVAGSEGRDPKEDFAVINRELEKFNPDLAQRPMLVAGNKCDLATEEQIADFQTFVEAQGYTFFPLMAPIREGVDPLLNKVLEELSKLPPIRRYEAEAPVLQPIEELQRGQVDIQEQDGVYFVKAPWLLKTLNTINFDDNESLQYFQRVLLETGVIDALREAGCQEGDTVDLYDLEFDFVE